MSGLAYPVELRALFRTEIGRRTRDLARRLRNSALITQMLESGPTLQELRSQCGIHLELVDKARALFAELASPLAGDGDSEDGQLRLASLEGGFRALVLREERALAKIVETLFR